MHFSVITIFPELFDGFWKHGMIRRAMEADVISGSTVNPRDFTTDRHRTTDDRPYGGGAGMVMKPEPLAAAITSARQDNPGAATVLLTPQGKSFTQDAAAALAAHEGLILVCGRYEGVDERIGENYIDLDLSIGDFVLTGGELAAMIVIDTVTRLVPGALGNEESAEQESFSQDLLEHDHFTRPPGVRGPGGPGGAFVRQPPGHRPMATGNLADSYRSQTTRYAGKPQPDAGRAAGAENLAGHP